MADIEITVDGGTSKRLLTGGKYCDKNILVTATGGGGEPEPPDDGKTRLYITVPANSMPDRPPPRNEVPLYIQQSVANGVTIDWGDGSTPETISGTGAVNTTHTYEKAGDYVISLDPAEGCELDLGGGDGQNGVLGEFTSVGIYQGFLKQAIVVGVGEKSAGAFGGCRCLVGISLNHLSLLPQGICFMCTSLCSLSIPISVTNMETMCFANCNSLKEVHMLKPEPPILGQGAFTFITSDCVIYVPVGSLDAYQTATNWSTYADQMQEEPA